MIRFGYDSSRLGLGYGSDSLCYVELCYFPLYFIRIPLCTVMSWLDDAVMRYLAGWTASPVAHPPPPVETLLQ